MAKFAAQMIHYEGPEMMWVQPKLAEGEKEIIPQFHDECSSMQTTSQIIHGELCIPLHKLN